MLRNHHSQGFVLFAEPACFLSLGKVETTDESALVLNRHCQKGLHQGMMFWESARLGMFGDVLDPKRSWVVKEYAQQSLAERLRTDHGCHCRTDPAGHECVPFRGVVRHHGEHSVGRARHVASRVNGVLKNLGQVTLGVDERRRLAEALAVQSDPG